jgi:hypothetical protein
MIRCCLAQAPARPVTVLTGTNHAPLFSKFFFGGLAQSHTGTTAVLVDQAGVWVRSAKIASFWSLV